MNQKSKDTVYRSVEVRLDELQLEKKGIRERRIFNDLRLMFWMAGLAFVINLMKDDNDPSKSLVLTEEFIKSEIIAKTSKYKNGLPRARREEIENNVALMIKLIQEELGSTSPGTAFIRRRKTWTMPTLKLTLRKTRPPFT